MSVYPECEINSLNDCKPGRLVRIINPRNRAQFAITVDVADSDGKGLVILQDNGPGFQLLSSSDDMKVLVYHDSWFLNVNHHGSFEAPARNMYEARGCLIREEGGWLMNISLIQGQSARQLDFSNFELKRVSGQLSNIAVFGEWTIYLGDRSQSPDRWTEIFTFEYQPPEGQDN